MKFFEVQSMTRYKTDDGREVDSTRLHDCPICKGRKTVCNEPSIVPDLFGGGGELQDGQDGSFIYWVTRCTKCGETVVVREETTVREYKPGENLLGLQHVEARADLEGES